MGNIPDSRPSWVQRHPAAFAIISLFAAAFLIRLWPLIEIRHSWEDAYYFIELARSLCVPAHVYLWDEPLNYLDVDARERIEAALLDADAAFIFVEHDATFVDRVATRRVSLEPVTKGADQETKREDSP